MDKEFITKLIRNSGYPNTICAERLAEILMPVLHEQGGKMFPVSECCKAGANKVNAHGDEYYTCTNCKQVCTLAEWSKLKQLPELPERMHISQIHSFNPSPEINENLIIRSENSIGVVVKKINEILDYLKAREW
jgi:cytidine deaminase